jgi:transposase
VTADRALADRLRDLGLPPMSVETHANRTVMVSLGRRGVLRLHRGYAAAPDHVLRAIVGFLDPRVPRRARRRAEREFLEFPVEEHAPPSATAPRRERPRPGDMMLLHRLTLLHERFNTAHFGGSLGFIPIRLSARMRTRLGELELDTRSGRPSEIAISRRHILRHPWSEVEHTLLHEMVHQWQSETGLTVDHGRTFRRKAAELGIETRAKRLLPPRAEATTA